jgi:hypothetical protein
MSLHIIVSQEGHASHFHKGDKRETKEKAKKNREKRIDKEIKKACFVFSKCRLFW